MKNTMKLYSSLMVLLFFLFTTGISAQTEKQMEVISDAEEAKTTLIKHNPNLASLFEKAAGYVIFPNVGKGAYILGGAAGNGAVYQNGNLVGMAQLRQLDIGFQLGGKAFIEALIFQTDEQFQRFKKGNFELSANASAVIIEEGVSKSVEFQNGVAVVTKPKAGAMAGISVGGQKFDYKDL